MHFQIPGLVLIGYTLLFCRIRQNMTFLAPIFGVKKFNISETIDLLGVKSVFPQVSTYLATFRTFISISKNYDEVGLVHHGHLVFW